jgi:hypothetical protein
LRRLHFVLGAVAVAAVVLVGLLAGPAFAHTEKGAGQFKLLFGWQHEPTYSGIQNAVQLFVHDAKGNPVDDLGSKGVTVQVSAAGQTSSPLTLQGSFDKDSGLGTHGEFDATIIPLTPGTYTFHITGDINGTAVDVSASSSDTTFNNVQDPAAIEFPGKAETNVALTNAVNALQSRLAAAQSEAANAKSSAGSARTVAIIAIIVAVVLGVIALAAGRRKGPTGA